MAKNKFSDQLQVLESYINDIPLIINPCKECDFIDDNGESHIKNVETCKRCCWYYGSNFKQKKVKK